MKIINKLREFILEEEFTITILKNKINVVNYLSIDHFDNHKIIIKYVDGKLIVTGKGLVVSKLLSSEVLITGEIKTVELG